MWWAFYFGTTIVNEGAARRIAETFALVAVALWAFVYAHTRG